MVENCLHGSTRIVEKLTHLACGVALGHKCNVDAVGCIGGLLKHQMRVGRLVDASNQNIRRIHIVLHRRHYMTVIVEKLNRYLHCLLRHRHKKNILKRAGHSSRLLG